MKNKIGWCNLTFNPVWGCLNKCPYCYARAIAKRFWKKIWMIEANHQWKEHPTWAWTGDHLSGLKDFKPTFLEAQFDKKFPQKTQKIFVGSMSEIYYWGDRWVEKVLGKVKLYPQHIFQFLTRHPEVYLNYDFPKNCWLGVTIVDTKDFDYLGYEKFKISNPDNLKFISFEPLLNEVSINLEGVDWVILGAETGNRKDKIFTKRHWIEKILVDCYKKGIPVYIKDSIIKWQPQLRNFKGFPKNKTINKL